MNTKINSAAAAWPFPVQPIRMVRVNMTLLTESVAGTPDHTAPIDPVEVWLRLGASRLSSVPVDADEVALPCSPKSAHEMLVFMQQHWDFPNLSWAELDLLAQIINLAGEHRK